MSFSFHLQYQFLSTNYGGKRTVMQRVGQIIMKDQNPNFGHF